MYLIILYIIINLIYNFIIEVKIIELFIKFLI